MEAVIASPGRWSRPRPVAPWWHTVALVGLFAALALSGALFQRAAVHDPAAAQQHPRVLSLYVWLVVLEWGLVYYVWKAGLRRTGTRLADLVGGRWGSARDVLRDVALAALMWGLWTGIAMAWMRFVPSDRAASIANLLPQGPLEMGLGILVAISAGICEEIVFRGYLQRQFESWLGRFWPALVLQSLVFGVGHGYQGLKSCGLIAIFGALYGVVARWRRSLRPGMLGHALTDLLSALFRI